LSHFIAVVKIMDQERSFLKPNLSDDISTYSATDFYEKIFKQTREEWKKFIRGDIVNSNIVPCEVLDSWLRCRQMGIDPLTPAENKILTGNELQDLLQKNTDFIAVSLPIMKNLYRFLAGSGFLVCLLDHRGYILEIIGDHDAYQLVRNAYFCVGALWDEKTCGTTGGGMIHILKKPSQLIASQHYKKIYHQESASNAPIFDAEGNLMGGLTLTARYYRTTFHTLGMAVAAAQAIENELRMKRTLIECKTAYEGIEVASSYQKAVIASIPEALLAITREGIISLINDNARRLFTSDKKNVEGIHIRDFFGDKNSPLLTLIEATEPVTDVEVRVLANHAINDYILTCYPILTTKHDIIGKIIIFNELTRAKTLATKMMGAKANFFFEDICGENPRFLMTIAQAKMVAQSHSNVILLGKSGTGKDIFAQAIHNASSRRNGPYIAINCAAIPRDLITSELFGYSEGAFTGSRRGGSPGKFELADGGTIFLDEIAETPLDLQAVLLRVIEDKSITRIGGRESRLVDVRIVAATNKDLREEIRKGTFREDLYYRLNVFAIQMVPLNERPDDITKLFDFFVKKYGITMGKKIIKIDKKIIETFVAYPWPGNVRELQNAIERMMNYCNTDELTADLIPAEIVGNPSTMHSGMFMESPEDAERKMINALLKLNFRKNKIAEKMKISRATLYNKIKKYGLY
jgi:sigma-54 dependent transcriptional regulator, acetoin dehydrogenase operon transcriptional activator AcoR